MPERVPSRESNPPDQSTEILRSCPACGLLLDRSAQVCPRDGTTMLPPVEQDSNFADKYEFLATIGSGGMGVIYKARQIVVDKLVAIKMLHQYLVSPEAFRRFQLEEQATGMLSHPNIVAVYDLGITDSGQPYLVMEFVDGITLSQLASSINALSMNRFVKVFLQVCDGFAHAHSRDVLHRDIKPSNIMIVRTKDGAEQVRIMDFGISEISDDSAFGTQKLTKSGDAIGSPLYMSPEQGRGAKVDARSDLYSLGCVMYELLAGRPPFLGSTTMETLLKHFNEKPVPPSKVRGKKIDEKLESMVLKLLQKKPEQRYQSMDELKKDLQTLLGVKGRVMGRFVFQDEWRPQVIGLIVFSIVGMLIAVAFVTSGKQIMTKINSYSVHTKRLADDNSRIAAAITTDGTIADLSLSSLGFSISDAQLLSLKAPHLKSLSLSGQKKFSDQGLDCLKGKPVATLILDQTPVHTLDSLVTCKTIASLSLEGTNLSDDAFKAIVQLDSLQRLNLSGALFSDAALKYLSALSSLRNLDLRMCTKVGSDDVDALKSQLKNCDIQWTDGLGYEQLASDEMTHGNYDKALVYLDLAITNLRHEHNFKALIESYEKLGTCLIQEKHLAQAEGVYKTAIEFVSQHSPNNIDLPVLCSCEAQVLEQQDNVNALDWREKAAALFDKLHRTDAQAIMNMNSLGDEYSKLGQTDKAMDCLNKALAMGRLNKDPLLAAISTMLIGDVYNRTNQPDKAQDSFQRAYDSLCAGQKQLDTNAAGCLVKLAKLMHQQGDKAKAINLLKQGLERTTEKGARAIEISCLADLLTADGKAQEADKYKTQLPQ